MKLFKQCIRLIVPPKRKHCANNGYYLKTKQKTDNVLNLQLENDAEDKNVPIFCAIRHHTWFFSVQPKRSVFLCHRSRRKKPQKKCY